jgi:hypothetical protein
MLGTISLLLSDICSPARALNDDKPSQGFEFTKRIASLRLDPKTVSFARFLLSHFFVLHSLIRISKPLALVDAQLRKDISAVFGLLGIFLGLLLRLYVTIICRVVAFPSKVTKRLILEL